MFCLLLIVVLGSVSQVLCGSFSIDYDDNTFLKDGKPFYYMSGSYHYSRTHYMHWEDRMIKAKAAGLDAIQTYIPWNVHESVSGEYDFSGQQDIGRFFQLAQKHDLAVVLRAGPYICGEWEFGGLPAWILKQNGSIVVRSMDPVFIKYVDRWFSVLLPKIKPYLYINGGPVIMVQIENEYGSYFACDRVYMAHLRDTARKYLGDEVVLFTTDGAGLGFLKCGAVKDVYATVDFGPGNMTNGFAPMRQWNPKGPLVNSEFYTGWLDHWGDPHAHGDTKSIVNSLTDGMKMKASVNMYMFEGGTNFGYMNGADPTFAICPTSYDYDSPLSEAGDITDKYMAIREAIGKFKPLPPGPVPANTKKYAYGKIAMQKMGTVLDMLNVVGPAKPYTAQYPLSMEQVDQNYGFILYRHVLDKNYASSVLTVEGIRDRGYVMLNGMPLGLLDRNGQMSLNAFGQKGQNLDILVENQGRINFGSSIVGQRKGILGNVEFAGTNLTNWEMYPLDFSKLSSVDMLRYRQQSWFNIVPLQPTVYHGTFSIPSGTEPCDTYFDATGWSKGQLFINDMNVGRYWPDKGPQVTLYVPKYALQAENHVYIVELEYTASSPVASFVDIPYINSTVRAVKPFNRMQMMLNEM